jgi:hypothetical protein
MRLWAVFAATWLRTRTRQTDSRDVESRTTPQTGCALRAKSIEFLIRIAPCCAALALLGGASIAEAGLLVTRSDKGFSFIEAYDLTVNGKDKVLSLGPRPVLVEKPPTTSLNVEVLKDTDAGVLLAYEGGVNYLLPRVNLKNEAGGPADIWKSAEIAYRTAPKDKTTSPVTLASFAAYLPEGLDELVRLCRNERALELIGGKNGGFATEVALISAVAAKYKTDPAAAPLKTSVENAMQSRFNRFQTGTAGQDVLLEALKFSQLSEVAYPDDPAQMKLRQQVADLKRWLDRRVAVLNAFSATERWDPFLIASRDFSLYQEAYPEIASKHLAALKASLDLHRQLGEERLKASEYAAAYREFKLALARNPADEQLQQRVVITWTDYSRQYAIDHKGDRKQLSAGQLEALNQNLVFAQRYREEGKLDLALKKVQDAEQINADSLEVLLRKAEVLGAQGNFTGALSALDRYDKIAVDEERQKASQLRSELLFKRTSGVDDAKNQWQTAWKQMNFIAARDAAMRGLRAKDDDPDLLYSAGAALLATRDSQDARKLFLRSLEISDTLQGNDQQRALLRRLLAANTPVDKLSRQGDVSWLSGAKLPRNTFYDPVSLAFKTPIERIDASGKMKVYFEWQKGYLVSISPSWEKPDPTATEKKISFVYNETAGQVVNVVAGDERTAPTVKLNPDEVVSQSAVVLLNDRYVDPVSVQRLTGQEIAETIAGNPYFNPFVWMQPCYFRIKYDDSGRVAEARQLAGLHGAPTDNLVQFEWQDSKLMAVRGFQVHGQDKAPVYNRTLQYEGDRLIAEDIEAQGRVSHIKYRYEGDRLIGANCDKDTSADGRSRLVTFAGLAGAARDGVQ